MLGTVVRFVVSALVLCSFLVASGIRVSGFTGALIAA